MDKKTFGKRLSECRKQNNLSRAKLGEKCGDVSEAAVGAWERGEYIPELEKLLSLAETFKISLDWLLGRPVASEVDAYDYHYAPEHLALIDRWVLLPPDMQDHIRAVIERIALPYDPRYRDWESRIKATPKHGAPKKRNNEVPPSIFFDCNCKSYLHPSTSYALIHPSVTRTRCGMRQLSPRELSTTEVRNELARRIRQFRGTSVENDPARSSRRQMNQCRKDKGLYHRRTGWPYKTKEA